MNDSLLIATTVRHGDKWFHVSTINRDTSAVAGPFRFAETIVWTFDPVTRQRGGMVWQDEDREGSIARHLTICQRLHESGVIS